MKILVTAKYTSGASFEGGSSRFFKCLIDEFKEMGHDVTATPNPAPFMNKPFDLIICSHFLEGVRSHPAKKIFIAHGIIADEKMTPGADRYVAVSDEVRAVNKTNLDIDSYVIGQPIKMGEKHRPGDRLKKILIIRREPVESDPFAFLCEKYDVRYSDLDTPIEEQIDWADLCITLGRGALESMARGKPVLVADNRPYIGACGDGYVTPENISEIGRCNFSGRRFRHKLTREWIEDQLAQYDPDHSDALHACVKARHDSRKVAMQYLTPRVAFGVLVNDPHRLDMVFRQSAIDGSAHTIKMPETATKGLNRLLEIMEEEGAEIGVLAHQDMYFRQGWVDQMQEKIAELPDSWIVAGIIGKDMRGKICGRLHDMRMPLHFSTSHDFPEPAACFDECCIIVNLKKGFRFDEGLPGFDLYGTLCVLQAKEMGGTAWIIDAFAEHYCTRSFDWFPGKDFEDCFRWIHQRFPDADRIDSTVIAAEADDEAA